MTAVDRSDTADLTDVELRVLAALADGRSNTAIAADLFLSERTLKRITADACRKLGAANRLHAVAIAFRLGLLT